MHLLTRSSSIAFGKPNPDGACIGMLVFLGGKEIEIDAPLRKEDFLSGSVFGQCDIIPQQPIFRPSYSGSSTLTKKFVPLKPVSTNVTDRPARESGSSKAIPLEPVNLLRKEGNNSSLAPNSYWAAHWSVHKAISSCNACTNHRSGENVRVRSTKHGTGMRMLPARTEN